MVNIANARLSFNHLIFLIFALLLLSGSGSTWASMVEVSSIWIENEEPTVIVGEQELESKFLKLEEVGKEVSNVIKCIPAGSTCIHSRNCCPGSVCNLNMPTPRCVLRTVIQSVGEQELESKFLKLEEVEKEVSNVIKCIPAGSTCIHSRNCCPGSVCNLNMPTPRCVLRTVIQSVGEQELESNLKLEEVEKEVSNVIKCIPAGSTCIHSRNCCPGSVCNLNLPTPRCVL